MGLLQANVSSATVIQDKKDKNDKKIDETKDVNILSENALLPTVGLDGTTEEEVVTDISVYVVRKGDTISQIADMFEVTPDTIRWSNDLKVGQKLVEGDILLISPVSGVIHTVVKGETLNTIAKKYKVDVSEITSFNDLPEDGKLEVGDEIIVPGGEIANSPAKKTAPKTSTKEKYIAKDLGGYFINPVPEYRKISQRRLHAKNGVDIAAPTGTPIVAAAPGTVIFARTGRNGGYGYLTIISHPNGTETLYAHQSVILVHIGDKVSRGEIIGKVGSTGKSTGPHLHYEIHGARNNTVDLPIFR